jgi:Na+-transporting methylmalonyl-CoA/oxaloacetate decarboxylase gamma subunit
VIESLMYMGIGFLFAVLTLVAVLVAVIRRVDDRAVRLTTSRLLARLPQSMEEIEADKDLLRAEFAMSTCRFEKSLEQLKHKSTEQIVELGKRGDVINRLKINRDALNVELTELKAQLEALKQRPIASRGSAKARRARSSRGRLAADSNDAKQRAL